jgi:hypothetical protein
MGSPPRCGIVTTRCAPGSLDPSPSVRMVQPSRLRTNWVVVGSSLEPVFLAKRNRSCGPLVVELWFASKNSSDQVSSPGRRVENLKLIQVFGPRSPSPYSASPWKYLLGETGTGWPISKPQAIRVDLRGFWYCVSQALTPPSTMSRATLTLSPGCYC